MGKHRCMQLPTAQKILPFFEYFINKGVDVNQSDKNGNTAFVNAVNGSNNDVAIKLFPMVKNINHSNVDGYSALTYAVRRNNGELFNFLLSKNASLNIADKKGNNLVYHAFDAYDEDNKDIFESQLATFHANGIDFKGKQSEGNTLLHLSVEKQSNYLIEKAIQSGVDINQKNGDGLTPLHMAAMKAKNSEVLIQLLDHGADKNILTDFDESAFDLAVENELLGKAKVDVQFLKQDSK